MKTHACPNCVHISIRQQATLALCFALMALAIGTLRVQAVPTRSSPVSISAANLLVSVNPDTNTISVFDASASTPVKLGEATVGREPSSVAISPSGATAYVANAADGTVSVVDLATRAQVASVNAGAEPMALALSPNGTRLYVANSASGTLMVFNTATVAPTLVATVFLSTFGTAPRAIAVTDDGDADDTDETIFVAMFYAQLRPGKTFLDEGQDDQREGRVVAISAATSMVLSAGTLSPIANAGFNSNGQLSPAPGQVPAVPSTNPQTFTTPTAAFPNQLAGVAIQPGVGRAYVVSTAASPNGPVRFNQNMHGLLSVLNTVTRTEITAAQTDPTVRRTAPLNMNQGVNLSTTPAPRLFNSNPTAIAWRPDGSDAWITVQQSDLLVRMTVDANGIPSIGAPLVAGPSTIVRVDLQSGAVPGKAPRGIVINSAGTRAYVLNYVSRSITVVDISNPTAPSIAASVQATALPAPNTPDAVAQLGAEMFFSGRGPNGGLASEAWGSCASCHPGGRADNVTWMFDGGPRQTIALDGTFGPTRQKALQRILNWSAVRDEIHDFELNSRNVSGGRGIIDDDRLFLAIGGGDGPSFSDTNLIEQFHQVTGALGTNNDLTATPLPKLPSGRRDFAIATSPDGHVFIIGGRSGAGQGTLVSGSDTVLEFNPRNNTLQPRSSTGFTPRHSFGAAAVRTSAGVRIYAFGGYTGTVGTESPVATVEEYNPASDSWRTVASLPTATAQFASTVAGGANTAEPLQLVHVVSGNGGSENAPSVIGGGSIVQRFQPDAAGPGTWSAFSVAGLTPRRNHGAATVLRGVSSRVFVIGGQDAAGTVLDTVEEYTAQAVTVVASAHTSLPSPRARFGIAGSLSTQQIYVMGGVDGAGTDQTAVFEYTVANNGPVSGPPGTPSGTWVTRANLSAARHGLQVSSPPGVVNFLPVANTGRSVAQDALAEFVRLRIRAAKAPVPATDPGAQAGRTLFGTVGLVQPGFSCASCHGGANWTRSIVDYTAPPAPEIGLGLGNQRVIGAELRTTDTQPNTPGPVGPTQAPGVLVNVGTFTLGGGRVNEVRPNAADVSQAINPLGANGFNVPSLLSIHEGAPYYYSGLAQTLDQVLDGSQDGNGGVRHHFVSNPAQRAPLIAFLRSIDDTTPIFPGSPGETTINCSSNITIECTGGLTPVTFTVTAANANGPVPVTTVPPSGTGFRVGTSNVVGTASDGQGGTVTCSFTVTVVDTTPPTLTCNSNITTQATSASGAVVSYTAGAFDACGIASFVCLPPPGSTFPIGTTTVLCYAIDDVGNSNSCTFTVTVEREPTITITRQPCDNNICLSLPGLPPILPGGTPLTTIDFNANDGGFTVLNLNAPFEGPWTYNAGAGTWSSAGQGPELQRAPSTRLTSPAIMVTQSGNLRLSFAHRYSFEVGSWDGGQVQVSVNGSPFFAVPATVFSQNGYSGAVLPNSLAELRGQTAFVETSAGYGSGTFITSIANLGCFNAGDSVVVRFLAAFDTNTRNGNPAWEIDSLSLTEAATGGSTAVFSVAASGSIPGNANAPVSVQWQKNAGLGFLDIPGANGNVLAFTPSLADNGSCFRAVLSVPGLSVTSAPACLTVVQPNTPPQFTKGPDQCLTNATGAQNVPGWATGILVHSLTGANTSFTFSNDFTSLPASASLFGVATVDSGVLKLTDAGLNSAFGGLTIPLGSVQTYTSLSASWKSRIGGGGGGGADGYSFNIASDLPAAPSYGNPGEEGAGTGLSVSVDTFANGIDDIGIEIRWNGARVAFAALPKDDDGSGNFSRKDTFVNASVAVTPTGLATFTYDGNVLSVQLPGYVGLTANAVMFGARTGSANDNHWIDDLEITATLLDAVEAGQSVNFFVSNGTPGLFAAQPAISPNGTLTFTPAPGACGTATVSVVLMDNGGTGCGGDGTSDAQTFLIKLFCNQCPVASNLTVSVSAGSSVNFQLPASDADGDALSYLISQPPQHGVVTVNILTGAASYSPFPGYCGPDSFKFTARDASCVSAEATVTIDVGSPGTELEFAL